MKTSINVSISFSVLNHYLNATVRTSLETSTAELSRAKFPKIVICNSFQLRWRKLVFLIRFFSRQSILKTFGEFYSNVSIDDLNFAINKLLLTGVTEEVIG